MEILNRLLFKIYIAHYISRLVCHEDEGGAKPTAGNRVTELTFTLYLPAFTRSVDIYRMLPAFTLTLSPFTDTDLSFNVLKAKSCCII